MVTTLLFIRLWHVRDVSCDLFCDHLHWLGRKQNAQNIYHKQMNNRVTVGLWDFGASVTRWLLEQLQNRVTRVLLLLFILALLLLVLLILDPDPPVGLLAAAVHPGRPATLEHCVHILQRVSSKFCHTVCVTFENIKRLLWTLMEILGLLPL